MDTDAPHAHPVLHATLDAMPQTSVVVVDAEPGVTGRVVDTVRAADVCLLVTEPTPFGKHDLELALKLTEHVGVPAAVIINRSDVGDRAVADFCAAAGVPVLLEIPFDRRVAAGYAEGRTLVDVRPEMRPAMVRVYEALCEMRNGVTAR